MQKVVEEFNDKWRARLFGYSQNIAQGGEVRPDDFQRFLADGLDESRRLAEELKEKGLNDLVKHVEIPLKCSTCAKPKPSLINIQCSMCYICKDCVAK